MQYYSTKTKRLYDTIKDLECAEVEYDKKQKEIEKSKKERSDAAKKVDELRELARNSKKAYEDALADFCKKYGSYHTTISSPTKTSYDFFEDLLDFTDFIWNRR